MRKFGDSGFTIIPFSSIWGIQSKNVNLTSTAKYVNFDTSISILKETSMWFSVPDEHGKFYAKSKTNDTEYIYIKGNLLYLDLDKIHIEKSPNL